MTTICRFSELNEPDQVEALNTIEKINKKTSTDPLGRTSWENYTEIIKDRTKTCPNAKNTLFLARKINRFVGYAAFYTPADNLWATNDLKTKEAYCSWIAVDPEHHCQGIATDLQSKIFDSGEIISVKGHVKKTNEKTIGAIKKFNKKGYEVSIEESSKTQYVYTISKKS